MTFYKYKTGNEEDIKKIQTEIDTLLTKLGIADVELCLIIKVKDEKYLSTVDNMDLAKHHITGEYYTKLFL